MTAGSRNRHVRQGGRARAPQAGGHRVTGRAVVAGAVVLLLGMAAGLAAYAVFAGRSGKYVVVPDVLGLTHREAAARLDEVGLEIEVDGDQDTTDVSLDRATVDDQTPRAGTDAEKDSVVTVRLEGVPDRKKAGASEPDPGTAPPAVAPTEGRPVYPFTREGSIACGRWPSGSTDYPYFGAPREGSRLHGAIDIYPPGGRGAPVKAMKDGTVLQVIPDFYTRADGEVCCGILIDHGDFVGFYGELTGPAWLSVGQAVKSGQQVGTVSGTAQLHFEEYSPGTKARHDWYGEQAADLVDPTDRMLMLYGT